MAEMAYNDAFFERLGKSPGVTSLCVDVANKVLSAAQASAPVDEGDYRDGLRVEVKTAENRNVAVVVGSDGKTMLIESKTGNLARALNQVKKSG